MSAPYHSQCAPIASRSRPWRPLSAKAHEMPMKLKREMRKMSGKKVMCWLGLGLGLG